MSRRSRVRAPPGATFRVTPLLSTCQKPLLHTPTCSAALPSCTTLAFTSRQRIPLALYLFAPRCIQYPLLIIHHSIFVPSLLPHTHTAATLRHASARACIHKQTQTLTMSLGDSVHHPIRETIGNHDGPVRQGGELGFSIRQCLDIGCWKLVG